jgi:hypothetical protein
MFYFHHKELIGIRRHYFEIVVRNDGLDVKHRKPSFGLLLSCSIEKSLLKFNFSELCLILNYLFSNGRSLMSVAVNTTTL